MFAIRPYRVALLSILPAFSLAGANELPISEQTLQIGDKLVIAGALDLVAFEAASHGSMLVVDLRTAAEGKAEERALIEELGLEYRSLPVRGAEIREDQVTELAAILDAADSETLVIVHCASGNRAGMIWAASQIRKGRDPEEVIEQVAPIVTKAPAVEAIRAYAAGRKAAR